MLDFSLGECVVVAAVALLMVKPAHMPAIIRVIARRVKGIKDSVSSLKAEIEAELKLSNPADSTKEPRDGI